MKKCIITDKPMVTIVMAIYNPNLSWLDKQLISLNNQDYENIRLIAIDDCSPDISFDVITKMFQNKITRFKYILLKNDTNCGSTKTFEKLTKMVNTPFISYCDQDDIWDTDKISRSVSQLLETNSVLVYGDVCVIDKDGCKYASSITNVWKNHRYFEGTNITDKILTKNFIIGCTILMKTEIAKLACDFHEQMVHDQWLGIIASIYGNITKITGTVMKYRIHGANQTGRLYGVYNKSDYYNKRIAPYYDAMSVLNTRFPDNKCINKYFSWARARLELFNKNLLYGFLILRYFNCGKSISLFEIVLKCVSKKQSFKLFKLIKCKYVMIQLIGDK